MALALSILVLAAAIVFAAHRLGQRLAALEAGLAALAAALGESRGKQVETELNAHGGRLAAGQAAPTGMAGQQAESGSQTRDIQSQEEVQQHGRAPDAPETEQPESSGGTHTIERSVGAAGSAGGFDETAVRELYAEWVRRRPQPAPTFPPDWEVVPLRFARNFQEHAAARPVLFFTDAGQVADFVRFSPAGGNGGLVLPHPEAAHSVEMVNLLFPSLDAPGLGRADTLTRLAPVPVRRSGQFWEMSR